MYNHTFNSYEQALIDSFSAMIPSIIASDPLISIEHIQIECARLLLIEAYKTKHAPRQWVCDTFGVSYKWLHRKNL